MKSFILTISLALFSTIAFSQNSVSELIQKKGQGGRTDAGPITQ